MATYSIVDTTDTTLKLVEDSTEIIYKKAYCSTAVDGDNVIFYAHEIETGKLRQQYEILYSDCVAPVAASAALLKIAIDAIIENYAGGGGSGTVTNVSALTLGTTGTDLSSSVANATTTPVITLNVPTASASNRGALSSTDWTTFNSKPSVNYIMALIAAY